MVGIHTRAGTTGGFILADNVYCQGCYMPYFTITGDSTTPATVTFRNTTFDTTRIPLVENLGANLTVVADASLNSPSITGSGGAPMNIWLKSVPFGDTGTPINTGQSTTNTFYGVADGTFGRVAKFPVDIHNRSVAVGQGYSLYTTTGPFSAPTCPVSAGGSVPTGFTFQYAYAPIYPNGSEGTLSQLCTAVPSAGNQTVTLDWTALPGVTKYTLYRGAVGFSAVKLDNSDIVGTHYVDTLAIPNGASAPQSAGGGPSGLHSGLVWGQTLQLGIVGFASLGAPANGTFTYCPDCTIANPCAGGGTGALAKRLNSVWVCN
jgi:hypothetical protein